MLNYMELTDLRRRLRVSQKELANKVGCTRNYISGVENGKEYYKKEFHNKYVNGLYEVYQAKENDKALEKLKDKTNKQDEVLQEVIK